MSTDPIDMPEKIFWLGQAVKCRILDADPIRDRISLSLILDSMVLGGRKDRKKQILKVGTKHTASVTKMNETSVDVEVDYEAALQRRFL